MNRSALSPARVAVACLAVAVEVVALATGYTFAVCIVVGLYVVVFGRSGVTFALAAVMLLAADIVCFLRGSYVEAVIDVVGAAVFAGVAGVLFGPPPGEGGPVGRPRGRTDALARKGGRP